MAGQLESHSPDEMNNRTFSAFHFEQEVKSIAVDGAVKLASL